MVTNWVPDLPNIKGFFGHLLHSILIFANGASCMIQQAYMLAEFEALFKHFFELKISNLLKSSGWGLEKSELSWEQKFS